MTPPPTGSSFRIYSQSSSKLLQSIFVVVCNPYLIIMIISCLPFKNYPEKHLTNNQWENHMFKNLFTPDCLSSIFYMILCHTFPSCNLDDILSCKNIFTPIIWRKSYTCEKINDSTDIYIGPCRRQPWCTLNTVYTKFRVFHHSPGHNSDQPGPISINLVSLES